MHMHDPHVLLLPFTTSPARARRRKQRRHGEYNAQTPSEDVNGNQGWLDDVIFGCGRWKEKRRRPGREAKQLSAKGREKKAGGNYAHARLRLPSSHDTHTYTPCATTTKTATTRERKEKEGTVMEGVLRRKPPPVFGSCFFLSFSLSVRRGGQ
ncbi:hypothetical protein BD410DRAFT_585082 [Rickenella mellea]|uniref:Uncharacterized protein n=1 Tax=Rickenella mellea TaxID=50990 RepID=A0A4Y7PR97_9AGAM|nr:hypothetical protein BD410DRAFT_585082 [Rickenella mellea]